MLLTATTPLGLIFLAIAIIFIPIILIIKYILNPLFFGVDKISLSELESNIKSESISFISCSKVKKNKLAKLKKLFLAKDEEYLSFFYTKHFFLIEYLDERTVEKSSCYLMFLKSQSIFMKKKYYLIKPDGTEVNL